MSWNIPIRLLGLAFPMAACTCLLVGCGETETNITGDVTLDGKPLQVGDRARGTVVFQPASRQGPTLNGMIDSEGHFQMAAGGSVSISPGVYLATVSVVEIIPSRDEGSLPEGRRITPDKYASSDESGLRVVIKPGANHVVLALETPVESIESDSNEAKNLTPTSEPEADGSDTEPEGTT